MSNDTRRSKSPAWRIATTLAVTEPVSWGVLYYAFAVFLDPMERDLGWSRIQLTGAFSLALLVSGFAGVPIGRWLDNHGPGRLMTAGSIVAVALVVAWSRVTSFPVFVVIWALIGICMAATFYEPAFAAIARWFTTSRSRALTLVTFGGGFASVVFIPLAAWLVERRGWREALIVLAAVLATITIPLHASLIRYDRLRDARTASTRFDLSLGASLRTRSFRWLSIAFGLAMVTNVAILVLLIPLLIARGESPTVAASATAAIGLLALPGRLMSRFPPYRGA
jgi:MFS family permease